AVSWAAATLEAAGGLDDPWTLSAADAYYDVAGARTTLRGRRDLEVTRGNERVIVRLRAGSPGSSAGAGLRVDLVVAALADPGGVAPARVVACGPRPGWCSASTAPWPTCAPGRATSCAPPWSAPGAAWSSPPEDPRFD